MRASHAPAFLCSNTGFRRTFECARCLPARSCWTSSATATSASARRRRARFPRSRRTGTKRTAAQPRSNDSRRTWQSTMADALIEAGLLSRDVPAERAAFGGAPIDLSGVLTSAGHELSRSSSLRLSHVASFHSGARLDATSAALPHAVLDRVRDPRSQSRGGRQLRRIESHRARRHLQATAAPHLRCPGPLPVSFAGAGAIHGAPCTCFPLG